MKRHVHNEKQELPKESFVTAFFARFSSHKNSDAKDITARCVSMLLLLHREGKKNTT